MTKKLINFVKLFHYIITSINSHNLAIRLNGNQLLFCLNAVYAREIHNWKVRFKKTISSDVRGNRIQSRYRYPIKGPFKPITTDKVFNNYIGVGTRVIRFYTARKVRFWIFNRGRTRHPTYLRSRDAVGHNNIIILLLCTVYTTRTYVQHNIVAENNNT